jgi:hypothetical protein
MDLDFMGNPINYTGVQGLNTAPVVPPVKLDGITGFNTSPWLQQYLTTGTAATNSMSPEYADYLKSQSTQGMIGGALGAGQLGLGVMSYLDNKKTANAQRKLLGQQYANNAEEMRHTKAARTAMSQGLGQYNPASAPKLS